MTIVLPVYNGGALLRECVESIAKQDSGPGTFDVVILDSFSTDGAVESAIRALPEWIPRRVVRAERSLSIEQNWSRIRELTDVAGIRVGHADDARVASGTTAIIFDEPTVVSADIGGGGPGTRETDLLDPSRTVERIDAMKAEDPQRQEMEEIFLSWWKHHRDNEVKAHELHEVVCSLVDPQFANNRRHRVTYRLNQWLEMRVAGFHLTSNRAYRGKWSKTKYRLLRVDPDEPQAADD